MLKAASEVDISSEVWNITSVTFRAWETNSLELRDIWEAHGLHIDEINLNLYLSNPYLAALKILALAWDPINDTFLFNTQNMGNFL